MATGLFFGTFSKICPLASRYFVHQGSVMEGTNCQVKIDYLFSFGHFLQLSSNFLKPPWEPPAGPYFENHGNHVMSNFYFEEQTQF